MQPHQRVNAFASILLVWITALAANGQHRSYGIDVQQLSDDRLIVQDEDLNYAELFENTLQLMTTPIDLNSVTADELRTLQILSEEQIENILLWRRAHGPLLDVHELQVVPGLEREVILRLLPFVEVIDPSTRMNKTLFRRLFTTGNTYVVARYERTLEKKKGFYNQPDGGKKFKGSADQLYFRMRSALAGDYSIGITGEKDEGEPFRFNPHQMGFDFTSVHVQLKNKGKLRNLVIGDYQTQFAQGLLFGGAFGAGKGGEQISAARKATTGFQPYTSVQESAYKRGAAITLGLSSTVDASLFYSNTRRDASGAESDSSRANWIQYTGLHRTQKEISGMKKLREQDAGIILHLKKSNIDGGIMVNYLHFDAELRKREAVYNRFAFNGGVNINAGFFLNYRLQNISFFSEGASSIGAGFGAISGVLISAHKNLDLCVLYRYYATDFVTFHANAFSESTQPQNERGLYWAWKYTWDRRISMNGYVDMFHLPWLGFRRYKPSSGYECFLRGTYRPSRDVNTFLQVREEMKLQNLPVASSTYQVGTRVRKSVSVHLDYGVGKRVRLKSRLQYNNQKFNERTTEGWAFIQDISFRIGKLELAGRHSLFDTNHYDNRVYVYERDAWSSYSMPAYSGVGVRNYALIEYKFSKKLTIWIRYARTRMLLGGEIGSGDETIEGNTRNDVKFQARFTF